MKVIREFTWANKVWLAATLAILVLGVATLAWQWRDAHVAALKQRADARSRHHAFRVHSGEAAR
jgi:hypothetical protein